MAVIGDIHGRDDLLAPLLDLLGDMPVLVVGDVCDRGPDTRAVIERLVGRGARGVRGNHEDWLLAWLRGEGFDRIVLRPSFGAEATLASYGVTGRTAREIEAERWRVPAAHRTWLESLAVAIDLRAGGQRFWMTHAGVPAHRSFAGHAASEVIPWLAAEHPLDLRWTQLDPEAMPPVDRPVVFGHVPRAEPLDDGSFIAIDTGAGTSDGGALTAAVLPERRFVSVGP